MIRFWDFKRSGAPPLLSFIVQAQHEKGKACLYSVRKSWRSG